jgi:type IV pilus assembly protein PilX
MKKFTAPKVRLVGARQRGVALIASLLLLLAVTLVAVSNMQTSTVHERMSGNLYDKQLAMQHAEAALLTAERMLAEAPLPAGAIGLINGEGIYDIPIADAQARWAADNTSTIWLESSTMSDERVSNAQFIIEYLGEWPFPPQCDQVSTPPQGCLLPTFRITSRIPAAEGRAEVILQSIWRG